MAKKKEQTPLMKQYLGVKSAHPDKILLFRMGDFYEMFNEDARAAAPILGIALTARNKKSEDQTSMCGVPHHSIAGHINKLLQSGLKVAICDQVEDAKFAKGLVKREVTRILSPGMVYDPETLDAHTPNYLCALDEDTLSFMDSTTGECFFYGLSDAKKKVQLISALNPVEIVVQSDQKEVVQEMVGSSWKGILSPLDEDFKDYKALPESARRLLAYAIYMQGEGILKTLKPFEKRDSDFRLHLSPNVLRHLEVFKTYKGDKEGSLFSAIDRTRTAGGGRLLRNWVLFPLADKKQIEERHKEISHWVDSVEELKPIRKSLYEVGDLERRLGKVAQPTCHPRDVVSLGNSLDSALDLVPKMRDFNEAEEVFNKLNPLSKKIESSFVEELPNNYRDGGFIAKGVNSKLDELIELSTESQKKVRELEAKERELTGITSLKVRYNNVFGYYIEVTNTHKAKVPNDRYQRKQTLTNAERYVTDELNELEKKVITAKSRRSELELELFQSFKDEVLALMESLLLLAHNCSQLDVYTSLAWLAIENDLVKPEMVVNGSIDLEGSRHLVVEQFVEKNFVANDIKIDPEQCILLTGPNMAGKSTVMRQVAIISIMAQTGSFVPARKASLPVVDKIFTRIGASDFLTEGLSTFMVEMQETAEMLNEATSQSLVILDEVGRGTSTYDGMSLAQSILEYFLRKKKSYTLFATHYHELTDLVTRYPKQLLNKHMTISEKLGEIKFLYHLTDGPAEKSYGIQVAKLAGLPKEVIQYSGQLLKRYESGSSRESSSSQLDLWQSVAAEQTESQDSSEFDDLLKSIRHLEIQKMTPLDALNKIAKWQQELS